MVSNIGMTRSFHNMDHSGKDPSEAVWEAVGGRETIDKIELTGVQVLVGTYLRPEKMKSGLIITSKIRDEDIYQGKVGLVLKVAPGAFVDGPDAKFNGFKVSPGDWVFYSVQDGKAMSIMGHHCRRLEDIHVGGRTPSPDIIL